MAGPNEQRLRAYLDPARRPQVLAAIEQWRTGATRLESVARALEEARPLARDNLARHTASAADVAFVAMRGEVSKREKQLQAGRLALQAAIEALGRAEAVRDGFDAAGPLTEPSPPDWEEDEVRQIQQMKVHNAQMSTYQSQLAAREEAAAAAIRDLDSTNRSSAETMRQIQGERPDVPSDGGGGGGGTPPSSGDRTPVSHSGQPVRGASFGSLESDLTHTHDQTSDPTPQPDQQTPVDPDPDPTDPDSIGPGPTTSGETGTPLGPGVGATPVGSVGTLASPGTTPGTTTGAGTIGGLAGAVGGGLAGGALGLGGAVRGGGLAASATGGGARPIGSTGRTASSGALGRGVAAGATTSRGAATGAGNRSAGAAAGRGTGAGGRGAGAGAGGRGAVGAGAGGRVGRRSKDEPSSKVDAIVDDHDWVDDEDGAPGVID